MAGILDSKLPVGLAAALEELGLSVREVLATARLPSRLLDGSVQRLPVPDYFGLWRAIRTVSGDPNIGIKLARSVRAELTEPLLLAIIGAADVAGALGVLCAYKRALSPETFTVGAGAAAGQVVLTCDWVPAQQYAPQALIDSELAFIVEICRRGTRRPDFAPRELRLQASALDAGADHAGFFQCPIVLSASRNALVFAAEDTALPFVTFASQRRAAPVPHLSPAHLDAPLAPPSPPPPPSPPSIVGRVRGLIVERLRGRRPSLHSVSHELALSGRGLQRLLKDQGTSFRQLLDDVRSEQAHGYLRSTSFSDGEVAFLLGFEDPSSFYRAFRSWSGMSPGKFRVRSTPPGPQPS